MYKTVCVDKIIFIFLFYIWTVFFIFPMNCPFNKQSFVQWGLLWFQCLTHKVFVPGVWYGYSPWNSSNGMHLCVCPSRFHIPVVLWLWWVLGNNTFTGCPGGWCFAWLPWPKVAVTGVTVGCGSQTSVGGGGCFSCRLNHQPECGSYLAVEILQ